jgi:EpsI family protein
MGEGLLRPLMTFTADCVVWGLRIAGVAVFRDGMLISTPAGDFEVAEACSGLRYLLASIAVGSIYGYLRFRTWRARLIVLASSVVIPIVVNGLRALTIVLVAQIWEMDAAMGLDHFVYGWIFFAFVVALIIWTGSLVHEPPLSTAVPAGVAQEQVRAGPTPGSWIVLLAAIFLVLSARVVVAYMERVADQQAAMPRAPALPAAQPGWTGPELLPGAWAPHFGNATLTLQGRYASTSGTVDLSITHYATQLQGSELVNSENELFDPVRWRNQSSREVAVPRRGWPTTTLQEVEILGAVERRLVWYWFDIGGRQTTSRTLAKLFELPARLVGRPDATLFAVSAAYAGKADIARDALAGFLAAHGSAIRSCAPAGSEAQCVQGGARDAGTAPEPAVP